jgi:Flp pilus assembly CpaF family ATPase
MLSAMSQGNDGSLSTIHARNAEEVFARIATYAAQHEKLDFAVTHSLIAGAIDFVVFVRKNELMGGKRTVTEVVEVTGFGDGQVSRSGVFVPSPVTGRAERRGDVAIMRVRRLSEHGYDDTAVAWPAPAW